MKTLLKLCNKKNIFIIILFFILFSLSGKQKTYFIPQKIIFIFPDIIREKSVDSQIIDETIAVLDKLDKAVNIVYVKERKWIGYKRLIEDLSNLENIAKFFLNTDVTGIVSVSIEERFEKTIVNLLMYDIARNKINIDAYNLYRYSLIEDITNYTDFAANKIKKYFPRININDLKKAKVKNRIQFRKNPKFELSLSGGIGYFSRQSFNGGVYSHGFTPYMRLGGKWYNFALDFHIEFSPLFNDLKLEEELDGQFFLYNFYTSLDFGVWLANQSFRLGLGAGLSLGKYYVEERYYNEDMYSDIIEYNTIECLLLFPYFSFSFLPIRSFKIVFDIGTLFSPSHIDSIGFSMFFPLYLKIGFRYFFYKQLFIEMYIPYYMVGMKSEHEGDRLSFHGIFNIGFGWRYEWRVE